MKQLILIPLIALLCSCVTYPCPNPVIVETTRYNRYTGQWEQYPVSYCNTKGTR